MIRQYTKHYQYLGHLRPWSCIEPNLYDYCKTFKTEKGVKIHIKKIHKCKYIRITTQSIINANKYFQPLK